jgi:hypothetical protein
VSAAVNYEIARSSAKYFTDRKTRDSILAAMMTRDALVTQQSSDDAVIKKFLEQIGVTEANREVLVARASSMGTKVVSFSPDAAVVQVWMAGLVGVADPKSPLPVSASWETYTLTLRWQQGDWKLSTVTSSTGPTPLQMGDETPSPIFEFRRADEEFDAPPYAG